jgi:hypothetical protein
MKLELTKEQVTYFHLLEGKKQKVKFVTKCIIENLEADLNREKAWYETTKEDVEKYLIDKEGASGTFLDEFTGVLPKEALYDWETDSIEEQKVMQPHYEILCKCPIEGTIDSVLRLIDGITYCIGDRIDFGEHGNKGFQKIDKFEIDYFDKSRITAYNGSCGIGIVKWQKQKPLFTTEDGVAIFDEDSVFYPNTHAWVISEVKGNNSFNEMQNVNKYKAFSTSAAAEEFILMNKPCLSLNDLLSVWGLGDRKCQENSPLFLNFKKLAKSKI